MATSGFGISFLHLPQRSDQGFSVVRHNANLSVQCRAHFFQGNIVKKTVSSVPQHCICQPDLITFAAFKGMNQILSDDQAGYSNSFSEKPVGNSNYIYKSTFRCVSTIKLFNKTVGRNAGRDQYPFLSGIP